MSILSTLAKIGGVVAAPFSGGASLALTGMGTLGDILSKGAQGAASGRQQEALFQMQQDALRNQQYTTAQNAQTQAAQTDLARKGFTETARSSRAKQALVGDLLQNLQDVNINVPGIQTAQISGGLRPSAMGADSKASLAEMVRQAILAQQTPDQFQGGQILAQPGVTALPQASGWEKLAGVLGTAGSLAGGLGSILPPTAQGMSVPYVGQTSGLPGMPGVDVGTPTPPESGYSSQQSILDNLKRIIAGNGASSGVRF
jgi:hypothetical protein